MSKSLDSNLGLKSSLYKGHISFIYFLHFSIVSVVFQSKFTFIKVNKTTYS